MEESKKTFDLQNLPAKVQRVVVDGLGRTKDDLIVKEVQPIFEAKTFEDMVKLSQEVKLKLERLQLFKHISILIDTCRGKGSSPNGYEVLFEVRESRPVTGGINTLIGNNDASLLFGIKFPNIYGRGERLQADYTHGTKQVRGYNVSFTKPINANPDVLFGCGLYQYNGEYPWSGYKELDRGILFDLTFPSFIGTHSLKWEGVWRDLRALSRTTSFAVREQAGHSIKSSLKHIYVRDGRDDPILPSTGTLLRVTQEYAGIGGSVEFAKQDVELQYNQSLLWDTVLQFSGAFGIMRSLNTKNDIKINDRFFLGGPLTLRGFNLKGVGPHSDEIVTKHLLIYQGFENVHSSLRDLHYICHYPSLHEPLYAVANQLSIEIIKGNALGADAYWLCAAHIYTPLPFRPGKGGLGDLFRTHFFVNAGNLGNISLNNNLRENFWRMAETFRWAYGGGIVLRMGSIARMELNYVIPVQLQRGDSVNPGLQFGIGLSFL